jgi:hypothetical protein
VNTKNCRILYAAAILILLLSFLTACDEGSEDTGEIDSNYPASPVDDLESPEGNNEPTADSAAPNGAATPAAAGKPDTWLVMLYQNADDEVLEQDIFIDLNEAEIVGSTDAVTIVSQLDRYQGAFEGDGDWTTSKRFLVTQDDDLDAIHSQEIADLGEIDSGNKDSLIDFAAWAIQTYPAEHYVLILSDHGAGWEGGWNDDEPVAESSFRMQDIDDALGTILSKTNIGVFELVGFDACLMGQVEVMSAIAPHARFAVGSEETEPSLGWAYASFLKTLNDNPGMSGKELGQAIVDSYINQDFRITDDQARRIFAEGDFSAESVAADLVKENTLTAVDLGAIHNLDAAINDLATALSKVDQSSVAEARAYAQSYTSVFGDDVPPSYIDLGHFADLLLEGVSDPQVTEAAQNVKRALASSVIAEMHGSERPGSHGLTLYFPNSELYQSTSGKATHLQYSAYVGRFATASVWDDFLTFHYTGETFDPGQADLSVLTPAQSAQSNFSQAAVESAPETNAEIAAPGAGEITVAALETSADTIGPDGSVTLTTEISGANIGYVYYYVSYFDEASGSYLTADMGFISAESTREIGGIYYPEWGNDSSIPIEFTWEPTLYYLSDGIEANDQFAFFEPEIYGVDEKTTTYTVRGVYTFADSGSEMDAVIRFTGDGTMASIFGFNGENGAGAPREITPQPGDTFSITEEWLDFDQNPDGEFVDYAGGTMTFGDKGFEMVPYYAYSGKYTLGVIVEDLNGNRIGEFTEVTVTD